MTPRHKLTKWDEWEIGAEYEYKSLRGVHMFSGKLQEINRKEGWIMLNYCKICAWRNRFRKISK